MRNEGTVTKELASIIRLWLTYLNEKKIHTITIFKLKKLSCVLLFLSCSFESFFSVDIFLLFDFITQKLKMFTNHTAFEFIQLFLFLGYSWISFFQFVCIQQGLVRVRLHRFLPRVTIAQWIPENIF